MQRLVVNPRSPQAWEIQLKPGTNRIGRSPANDFTINDPSVSGAHCEIVVEARSVRLKDLGSTNGTFVNQTPVQEALLRPGQRIRLGSVELLLEPEKPGRAVPAIDQVKSSPALAHSTPASVRQPPADPSAGATAAAAATLSLDEDKPLFCKNHYQNLARYQCPKCQRCVCDLCVNTRGSTGGGLKFCKICGSECVSLALRSPARPLNFFAAVLPAFKYPFIGDGLMLLLGGTFFFGFLDAANYISRHAFLYGMRALTVRAVVFTFILGIGYLFAYLKNVIAATAAGDQRMPDWPEFSEWQADIVSPMFQFVMIAVLSFGPALALHLWFEGDYPWLVALVALLGCFYFPMAFLGVAMFDTLAALNPLFIVGSIVRIPREYLVAALVFTGILALRWLSESGLARLLPVPLVPALVADLLGLCLLIVEARILGLLYRSRGTALGWFARRTAGPGPQRRT